ncbi:hypothetical protein RIF29_32991 [Crotalaria pallida]|uniref:Uncharacterized protein n=1 Tax=Crotalaria pallida TaxID=3830 RepID=A0AAN9HTT3_CROPI
MPWLQPPPEDALRLIRCFEADRAANWLAELCQYASDWADSISGESQVRMMVSGLFPTEIMPSAIEEVMGWPRIDLT